jgi:hypothetical protein
VLGLAAKNEDKTFFGSYPLILKKKTIFQLTNKDAKDKGEKQ